jgi:hypothetical protein
MSRCSSVGIVTGYVLDGPGTIPGSVRVFISQQSIIMSVMCNWGNIPGGQRQGCEADRSRSRSAKVKNGGTIPLLPHLCSWYSA